MNTYRCVVMYGVMGEIGPAEEAEREHFKLIPEDKLECMRFLVYELHPEFVTSLDEDDDYIKSLVLKLDQVCTGM